MKKPMKGRDWLEQAARRAAPHRAPKAARFVASGAILDDAIRLIEQAQAFRGGIRKALLEAREAARLAARSGPPKPPAPRKRRPDDGGEPMPAVPRPKPKPLSGGAAAPIEREKRQRKPAPQPPRVKARPTKVPSEADRSPNL